MNKVILKGNVGKQPELKKAGSTDICKFSIATNKSWTDKAGTKQEKTTWHNCICFGKTATTISKFVNQGDQILIEGEIDNSTYDKNGVTMYSSQVLIDRFEFCGKKTNSNTAPGIQQAKPFQDPATEQSNDDLPF